MTRFSHDPAFLSRFPALRFGTLVLSGLDRIETRRLGPADIIDRAKARLAGAAESDLPEIRAWRAAYAAMGLKPTQVRCAAEALLRRLRLDGALPEVGPLVDVCNAIYAAFAIPLAVFDLDRIEGDLTVTRTRGDEPFLTFGGAEERPEPGEVIFRDAEGVAPARRWAHRQGAVAAVSPGTRRAFLVAEAMHATAEADLAAMLGELSLAFRSAGASVQDGKERER